MSKRKETLEIEEQLYTMVRKQRLYGCSEVTIGFYRNGHGDEIVDFCTMDSKGIVRCYEIKVTLADFKSKAKLSWYGHFNYLVVTEDLLNQLTDELLEEYIPKYVGIAIPDFNSWSNGLKIIKRAKKQSLSTNDEIMIKESLVRSLSYKVNKVRDANNLEKFSTLNKNLNKAIRDLNSKKEEYEKLKYKILTIEHYLRWYYNIDFDLDDFYEQSKLKEKTLPESITLELTDRGKEYNDRIKNHYYDW